MWVAGVGKILDVVDVVEVEEAEGWRGGAVGGVDCGGRLHGMSCGQVCAKSLLVFGGHPLFALVRIAEIFPCFMLWFLFMDKVSIDLLLTSLAYPTFRLE